MIIEDNFNKWYQLRGNGATLVTANDTAISLTGEGGNWASKPAVPAFTSGAFNCAPAVAVDIETTTQQKLRTIEIIGYGTDADNETATWILYAYRREYSPACRVATGVAIIGTMDTDEDPVTNTDLTGWYVDTWGVTATGDYWNSVSVRDDALNGCSRLSFDLRGYKFLYLEIQLTTAASFGAAFSGV